MLAAVQNNSKMGPNALLEPVGQGFGFNAPALQARLVAQLRSQGIGNEAVLGAIGGIERHRFLDTALATQAYEDTSLPIGFEQTISKPSVVARMLELLCEAPCARAQGLGRVLEIGTGCGYQAALLAKIAAEVYSIERVRGLHEKARTHLRGMRLANLHLIFGDGMPGYPKGAPFAGIVSAAGGETIPQAWLEQLAVGARLIAPTVIASRADGSAARQCLVLVERQASGYTRQVLDAVRFVPLKSGLA